MHVRLFGKWAFEQGYSKYRVHRRVVLAAGFSQWLGRRGIRAREVSEEHAAQYLQHRPGQKWIERGDNPSLKQFQEFLWRGGIVGAEKGRFRTHHAGRAVCAGVRIEPSFPFAGYTIRSHILTPFQSVFDTVRAWLDCSKDC